MRFRLGSAALIAALIPVLVLGGCSGAQKAQASATALQVAQKIVTQEPKVVAYANAVSAAVAMIPITEVDVIDKAIIVPFDAGSATIFALAQAYVAAPAASTWAKVQAAVNALQTQTNATTLAAEGIKDPASQAAVKLALSIFAAAFAQIFALVQTTESTAQLQSYALQDGVHFAAIRRFMDSRLLEQEARENGVTVNQFFDYEARLGY